MNSSERAVQLLERISHCPSVDDARGSTTHPCSRVVALQAVPPDEFQVPEPWAGRIDVARLLFVSSNPSISGAEPYPRWSAPAAERSTFFMDRFGPGPGQVRDGVYMPLRQPRDDGLTHSAKRGTFWNVCKLNAAWIYGRPVTAGIDYALTEVVHCKSHKEAGVTRARNHCADMWLNQVLEASPATVVVVLGDQAHRAFTHIGVDPLEFWWPRETYIAGRSRLLLRAPHPTGRGLRRWRDHIGDTERLWLRHTVEQPSMD